MQHLMECETGTYNTTLGGMRAICGYKRPVSIRVSVSEVYDKSCTKHPVSEKG